MLKLRIVFSSLHFRARMVAAKAPAAIPIASITIVSLATGVVAGLCSVKNSSNDCNARAVFYLCLKCIMQSFVLPWMYYIEST